jgi:hypothetical protein
LNKLFCLPVKIGDGSDKELHRAYRTDPGTAEGTATPCWNFAHPLSSRSATMTLSYCSLTRLRLPFSATRLCCVEPPESRLS